MKIIATLMALTLAIFYFSTKMVGFLLFTFSAATIFLATGNVGVSIFAGAMSIVGTGIAVTIDGLANGSLKLPVVNAGGADNDAK